MKIRFITILFLPILSFSQHDCPPCKNVENPKKDAIGKYEGCLNDHNERHGMGKNIFNDGGQTDIKEGCWKNNVFLKGDLTSKTKNKNQVKSGTFVESSILDGKNCSITITDGNIIQIQEGEFISGILFNGKKTTKDTKSKRSRVVTIQNGRPVESRTNTENLFDKDDISCENGFTTVSLEFRNNHYFLDMNISGAKNSGEWMFDSGGGNLSIGRKLWDRLKSEGAQYEDLDISQIFSGAAGGESTAKYIKLSEINLGGCTVKNVIAYVKDDLDDTSLMGADFYKKFSDVVFSSKEKTVKFYE